MSRSVAFTSFALGATLALAGAAPALGQAADGRLVPEVIATGLAAPRGVTIGPDGTIYVVEAGSGGDQCYAGPKGQRCVGGSGAVAAIRDGRVDRVVTGLPSFDQGGDVFGPEHVALLANGEMLVTVALAADTDARAGIPGSFGDLMGTIVRAGADGSLTVFADLAAFEHATNPDGDDLNSGLESNPYGILLAPDGTLWATDAAGNDLLRVSGDGTVETEAVFHVRMVPPPMAADAASAPVLIPMQSVPTGMAIGPDGALYVTQFTGVPYPAGGARVARIVPGQPPQLYGFGLTNAMDLAFGPDGTLYVVEFAVRGRTSGDPTGAIVAIPPGGGPAVVVATEGITHPGGIAVDAAGTILVTNSTEGPTGGELLAIRP